MRWTSIALFSLCALLGACADSNVGPNIRAGKAAYDLIPAPEGGPAPRNYLIGPLDTVEISVFQEADISSKGVLVDAAGNISMPLIGRIKAAGLTTTELADLLAARLAERFYVNPQVTVAVSSSVAQRVTVQGEVSEPGIYPLQGPTTLLDAVALAKGETENAALRRIVIIRYVDGKRLGAVFDLRRIRRGDDSDPALLARDVIIVGHSTSKKIYHDVLRAAPLLNVFAQF
ncbi:polysaccharide biosynthesis/export family protein [soil metagenome]